MSLCEPSHTYLHTAHHILHSAHLPEDLSHGVGAAATGHRYAKIHYLRHERGLVDAQTTQNLSMIFTFESMESFLFKTSEMQKRRVAHSHFTFTAESVKEVSKILAQRLLSGKMLLNERDVAVRS